MSRQITYRYNPETDSYERIYRSLGGRIVSLAIYLLFGIVLGALLFFFVFFVFDSPTEENLRRENAQLRLQYNTMNRRLDASLKIMEAIRQRDDNYYRVLMQMDPLTDTQRFAGLDNENRYQQLQRLPDAAMLVELSKGLDMLDRQLYVQSRSFDELRNAAMHRQDRLRHTPAVLPVSVKNYKVASGYGYRIDPIYGTKDFHAGIDLTGKTGEPVSATADGVVAEAGWKGGMGYCVEIDHGYNYRTVYAHMNSVAVSRGQRVQRGNRIGEIGSTGKSIAPHLHYEVLYKDEPQNPVNYWFLDMTPEEYDAMIRQAGNAGNVMD